MGSPAKLDPDSSPGFTDFTLVLLDGECALCHRSAQFIANRKHAHRFRFAMQQDANVFPLLRTLGIPMLRELIIVTPKGHAAGGAEASRVVFHDLGGIWRGVAWLMRAVPRRVRDCVYQFVASRRIRWFGKAEQCDMMSAEAVRKRMVSDVELARIQTVAQRIRD